MGAAATSGAWGPMVWKGGKWVASKGPASAIKTGASAIKTGASAVKNKVWDGAKWVAKSKVGQVVKPPLASTMGMLPPFILNKTVGQIGKGIASSLGGSDTTNKLAQEGTEIGMTGVLAVIKKYGVPKVMKHVATKLGYGVALRTLGKLGLGALGTGATYGIGTGVMLAWTAKDLMDIYNIIQDME